MGDTELEKPCESCPKRSRCTEPCEQAERILPNDDTGKTWREKPWEFSDGNLGSQAAWGLTEDKELPRLFWHSWDRLTPRQREALMLRKREHMSFREIASRMKISTPRAFKLHRKALKGLTNSPIVEVLPSGEGAEKDGIQMDFLTTKDVLERFQIPYHRLAYLFSSRRVPEVHKTSSGSRLYGEGDVERIRMALENIGEATRKRCAEDRPGGKLG